MTAPDEEMIRYVARFLATVFKSKLRLVAEDLRLRQQLIVLNRRQARPRIPTRTVAKYMRRRHGGTSPG